MSQAGARGHLKFSHTSCLNFNSELKSLPCVFGGGGIEPKARPVLVKYSTSELHLQPFGGQGPTKLPRLALNLQSACLGLPVR